MLIDKYIYIYKIKSSMILRFYAKSFLLTIAKHLYLIKYVIIIMIDNIEKYANNLLGDFSLYFSSRKSSR